MKDNELCENRDITFENIYFEMNSLLDENEYMECSNEERKDLFLKVFKSYILEKIRMAGVTLFDEDSDVLEMVRFISNRQEGKATFHLIVNYILSIISGFQGWEVVWEINNTFAKEERELQVHSGLLNKFETGNDCDEYKSFAMLYCFFTDSLVKIDDVKQLELK